eukprot:gene13587-16612_t
MGYEFSQVKTIEGSVLSKMKFGGEVEKPFVPVAVPANMSLILHNIMQKINQTSPTCTSYGYESAAYDYLARKYHSFLDGHPVLVQPQCLTMIYFGNLLGALLDQMACAADVGAHFVAVRRAPEALHQHAHHDDAKRALHHARQVAFLSSFPQIIVHPSPAPEDVLRTRLAAKCRCSKYCWTDPAAPWTRQIPLLRDTLQNAAQ